MKRIEPSDLAAWRRSLAEEGDGELLDPTVAQQLVPRLMNEIEQLWADLDKQRVEFASETSLRYRRAALRPTLRREVEGRPFAAGHSCPPP